VEGADLGRPAIAEVMIHPWLAKSSIGCLVQQLISVSGTLGKMPALLTQMINVASTAGFRGVAPGMSAYVGSKQGVRGVTRQMAIELAPHGIRVLGVAPTFCVTEGNMAMFAANPNSNVEVEIPSTLNSRLGRVGVPDDVGRVRSSAQAICRFS
jgi:NAD(P)-dependent dehydrogenase (short-subunit alcohol dehydrogenase family)